MRKLEFFPKFFIGLNDLVRHVFGVAGKGPHFPKNFNKKFYAQIGLPWVTFGILGSQISSEIFSKNLSPL